MKLSPIIEELREQCPAFNRRVFGVAEFSQINESTSSEGLPAAYVIPLTETPFEPVATTRYKQTIEFTFAVVLVVSNEADEQGLNAWEQAVDLKRDVFQAILGQDDYATGRDWIQYEGASVVSLNRAALMVQLEFSINYDIDEADTRHGADIERLERFLRMFGDVDVIGGDGRPDGNIETKFHINLEK